MLNCTVLYCTSRPTVKLSTLWLTQQKIGCSPPLFATHTTFSARSPPYPHQTAWPLQASSSIALPLKDDKQCIPRVLYDLASSCPVLGLFSPSVFLYTLHSFHNNYLNLALSSSSAPGSRQLV